jgi:hypothetical protein
MADKLLMHSSTMPDLLDKTDGLKEHHKLIPARLEESADHQFARSENKKDFICSLKGWILSSCNLETDGGMAKQMSIYENQCYDVFDYDNCDHAIEISKRINLPELKFFAKVKPVKGGPRLVSGKGGMNWEIIPLSEYSKAIPLKQLDILLQLKRAGIKFEGVSVAIPARPAPDPILLGYFGRWYLEISRWE